MAFSLENFYLNTSALSNLLSEQEKQQLNAASVTLKHVKGETLFKEKSSPKGIYFIRTGKVKIFITNPNGDQSIIHLFTEGEFIGYRALIGKATHSVSAVAIENSVIDFISKDIFMELLTRSKNLSAALLKSISMEQTVWLNKLLFFSQYQVRDRIIMSLLILKKIYSPTEKDGKPVIIELSRSDLAYFVGTHKDTISRMLTLLKDTGCILLEGKCIIIVSSTRLLEMLSAKDEQHNQLAKQKDVDIEY